jgi:hypothetical protein
MVVRVVVVAVVVSSVAMAEDIGAQGLKVTCQSMESLLDTNRDSNVK